jgi:hypothetical protein
MTVKSAPRPTSAHAAPRQRRWVSRHVGLLGRLAGVLAVVVVVGLVLLTTHVVGSGKREANHVPVSWQRPVVSADGLIQRSGVKITQVAVTGDGGLVDLRFEIVDPGRASAVHDPATPPAVVDEESGLVVHELFMNHSHTGPYKAGVTYYLVFNNPGNWIRHGSKVSVMLGNAQVEHVRVP